MSINRDTIREALGKNDIPQVFECFYNGMCEILKHNTRYERMAIPFIGTVMTTIIEPLYDLYKQHINPPGSLHSYNNSHPRFLAVMTSIIRIADSTVSPGTSYTSATAIYEEITILGNLSHNFCSYSPVLPEDKVLTILIDIPYADISNAIATKNRAYKIMKHALDPSNSWSLEKDLHYSVGYAYIMPHFCCNISSDGDTALFVSIESGMIFDVRLPALTTVCFDKCDKSAIDEILSMYSTVRTIYCTDLDLCASNNYIYIDSKTFCQNHTHIYSGTKCIIPLDMDYIVDIIEFVLNDIVLVHLKDARISHAYEIFCTTHFGRSS